MVPEQEPGLEQLQQEPGLDDRTGSTYGTAAGTWTGSAYGAEAGTWTGTDSKHWSWSRGTTQSNWDTLLL